MDPLFAQLTMTGAAAMLLMAFIILWRHHVPAYVSAFQWQSLALAGVAGVVAWRGNEPELYLIAALIFALKVAVVPRILRRMEARLPGERALRPLVNTETSLLVSGVLSVAAYEVARPLVAVVSLPTRGGLPIALALILVSVFIIVSRQRALTQIVGFLMLENGIALLALLGAYGVPFIVELGVFLDVLLGVIVMQVVVHRIRDASDEASIAGGAHG